MTVEIARHWRLKAQRYSLIGEVCPVCQGKIFPPRDVCPHCAEAAGPEFQFSGKGEVYSYSTIYSAPEGFEEQAPYAVALIKLDEGPMLTAQLTDIAGNGVKIGDKVEMVTRKLAQQGEEGLVLYGYKFRPQMSHA